MSRLPLAAVLALAAHAAAQCPPYVPPPPPPPPPSQTPGDIVVPAGGSPTTPRPPTGWTPQPGSPQPGSPQPGPTTGSPGGPSAPAPSGPSTGGSGGPRPGAPAGSMPGARTGPRGFQLEDDLTTWDHWWEFNQDAFLRTPDHAAARATTGTDEFFLGATRRSEPATGGAIDRATIAGSIVPALQKVLAATSQRDVATACMLALARIGVEAPQGGLVDTFVQRLRDPDQTIRENAALALGLAAPVEARCIDLLIGLALDDQAGRKLRGETVDDRTRAFATYGLGLAAGASHDFAVKDKALTALGKLLADEKSSTRNVKVAAIFAIGSLELRERKYEAARLADRAVETLVDYFGKDLGAGERFVQSHVPTALARLLGKDHPRAERCKELFAAELAAKGASRRGGHAIAQSCALALGQLVAPNDDDDAKNRPDVAYSKLLLDAAQNHKDAQTRNFATLALGQIGGARNRQALLARFDRDDAMQERPWCALALGVLAHARGEAGRATTGTFVTDRLVCDTLGDAARRTKDPMVAGALAVATGLAGAVDATTALRQRLVASKTKEKLAAQFATGLALLGDQAAIADLQNAWNDAAQRPELFEQAAVALARLGDADIVPKLQQRLAQDGGNVAATVAAAHALALVGDHRVVAPLVAVLLDESKSAAQRAGAATALGGIADPRPLPWNSGYSANANYRAAAETLTDRTSGILDLL